MLRPHPYPEYSIRSRLIGPHPPPPSSSSERIHRPTSHATVPDAGSLRSYASPPFARAIAHHACRSPSSHSHSRYRADPTDIALVIHRLAACAPAFTMSTTEKKSKEAQLNRSSHKFQVNDVVLAKIRGFPAWPGIVMDDDNVPSAVLKERPPVKHRDLYTIRFFPAADYNWAFSKDLELLTAAKIDAFLAGPNRKKGDLKQAYELARDPTSWNQEQNTIVRNHEKSLQDAAEEEEENQDQLEEDEDEAEAEEEDDDDEDAPSKKRKRGAETAKIRESADKRKKAKSAEAPKPKSDKPSSKVGAAVANGEDKSEDNLDPETKKVKEWRHKVQKAFLAKDATINADDMPAADATFKTVEEYDGMTAEHLRTTKIGKVMKRIMQLADIPRDDEFHFKERAEKLCARWGAIMAGGEPRKDSAGDESVEPARENGDAHAAAAEPQDDKPKLETESEPTPALQAEAS